MQRLEPREFLAAAGAGLLPALWLAAVRGGALPDPLDHEAGLALLASLPANWPGFAPAILLALAAWAAGYGGWRWARVLGARPALAGAAALVAQLGPWTTLPLLGADLAGLAVGPVLLGLAHPRLALLVGAWSPTAAVVVALGGLLRRRWVAVLALLWLARPPVAAPAAAEPGASVPMYRAEAGAWFPLPPSESERWLAVAAWTDGRWVHPLSQAVSGSESESLPPMALPMAVAQVVVAAPPVDPLAAMLASLPPALAARLGGAPWAPPAALLLGGVLSAVLRRRPRWVGGLALLAAAAGGVALRPGPAPAVAELSMAELRAACAGALLFPAPEAPWRAGRVPAGRARAAGCRAPEAKDDATLVLLARLSEAGIDTTAAELTTKHDGAELAAALAESGPVLVDRRSLPGWGAARLRRELATAGVTLREEGWSWRLGG